MQDAAQPNLQQAAMWNEVNGKTWVELQPVLDDVLAPFERRLVEAGFPGEGGSVLDIGCGAGATSLAMARRLGDAGRCIGVDISGPLVTLATARARAEGLTNAGFLVADAQTHAFEEARFDAVISRFGVMFFDDPVAAFANIRGAVRPDGRLVFVAWRSPADNAFLTAATRAAAPFLPPSPPPDPDAPGQFAFADGGRIGSILEASGWSSVAIERTDVPCRIAEPDLMRFATRMGPVGAALREVDRATADKVVAALSEALGRYVSDGFARFTAACWQVSARA